MRLNLIMLRTVNSDVINLYENTAVEEVIKHFGSLYRTTIEQYTVTKKAKKEYGDIYCI